MGVVPSQPIKMSDEAKKAFMVEMKHNFDNGSDSVNAYWNAHSAYPITRDAYDIIEERQREEVPKSSIFAILVRKLLTWFVS